MINILRQTICNYSDSLADQVADLLPFSVNSGVPYVNRVRGRILPRPDGATGLFAPDTISWLRSYAAEATLSDIGRDCSNQTVVFTLPLLGITNRPLPGYKKGGFNLFKTIAKVIALGEVKNLDQCIIEFGSRFPVSAKDFNDELSRQICAAGGTINKKARLILYAHGLSNAALTSDLETLRLCALKTIPVINIDWLNIDSNWDVIWNPCTNLKPVRKKLEAKLTKFLDQMIEQICASRCDVIVNDTMSFFDSAYLSYRDNQHLPNLSKIIWKS